MTTTLQAIRERVVSIGPDENVVGIVTELTSDAREAASAKHLPNVVFLNAGVLHRVGPHRLHVLLARRLSVGGFGSLRIDLSGIGDSRNLPGTLTFRESSVADVRSAMDCLRTQNGATRFILFGLCSGADNGLATALADERVVGLILIDPPAYVTFRSQMRAIASKFSSFDGAVGPMATWAIGLAARRARQLLQTIARRAARGTSSNGSEQEPGRTPPPSGEYFRQLSALLDRGVKILCVFSGANAATYNHPGQIYESFPRLRGRLDALYFPAANHVFTELQARDALTDAVALWCRDKFG
jgi:pimeloyl-ACP methyl ester carboxylesterase